MMNKGWRVVLLLLSLAIAIILILACGVGYYVYAWLRVDPVAVAPDASEEERLNAVEDWLDELFESYKFNGGVLIVRSGEALLSKTCGFTSHTAAQRLDNHSAFRLASVSKQFTAAGILRLTEMGLLGLDDPVAEHLEGFFDEKVTIRHLLNQTSGIADAYMTLAKEHRDEVGDTLTIANVVKLVSKHGAMERPPGEEFEYSKTNYVLLAGVVESLSGVSFEEFMREELFRPLGMNDTRVWNLLSADRSANQADDFCQSGKKRFPVEPTWIDGVAGDGAVFCSLHDMVIWDRFWETTPLISDKLLAQATARPRLNDGTESDYGFGWMIERNGHWHNGAWLGANTFIARYPETGCCLVVLDNSSNLRADAIADRLIEALEPILFRSN